MWIGKNSLDIPSKYDPHSIASFMVRTVLGNLMSASSCRLVRFSEDSIQSRLFACQNTTPFSAGLF